MRLYTFFGISLLALLLVGCGDDVHVNVTGPDVTVVTPVPGVTALPAPAPQQPEPGSTNLMDPPSDSDAAFNVPPLVGPDPDPPPPPQPSAPAPPQACVEHGRGGGNGSNGQGRGDEHRSCAKP